MLTAIRLSDKAKVIGEFIEKNTAAQYCCENCEKPVVHHRSEARLRVGHFAHKAGASFCASGGETLEHMRTKLDIYAYLKDGWGSKLKTLELEAWISKRAIRPDVYIETHKGNRIAIEVQASALTVDEITRRTRKYHSEGIHVLWVLPFEFPRFFERYLARAYRLGYTIDEHDTDQWIYRDKVRLHAYEQFIYWVYLKRLVMWDLDHKHSDGFVVTELSQHVSDDVTFYSKGGEEHSYSGKKSKTQKVVDRIIGDVGFDQFEPNVFHSDFTMKFLPYSIPARHIMNFNADNWEGMEGVTLPPLPKRRY